MRRRFGRGRKGRSSGGSRTTSIDAARIFEKIVEAKLVSTESLEPVNSEAFPDTYAAVGVGEGEGGRKLVVAFSPDHGGDAALAGLAHAQALAASEGFNGDVIAVCPQWSIAARRRLALLGQGDFSFRAIAASALADGENAVVSVDAAESAAWLPAARVADRLVSSADRELFARGLAALEGLAAKHGGVVRGAGSCVEFVLLARRVALIRADDGAVSLETILPEKSNEKIDASQLATVLDRLEGQLRKRLNDRRLRTAEEGVRSRLWSVLATEEKVRQPTAWPLGGTDVEILDFTGVGTDGIPVVGALRSRLTLQALGLILDAVGELKSAFPALLADAEAPVRLDAVRLALAAAEYEESALSLLPLLAVDHKTYDIVTHRGRDSEIVLRGEGAAAAQPKPASSSRRRAPRKPVDAERDGDASDDSAASAEGAETAADAGSDAEARPGSGRRRRGRGRRGGSRTGRESTDSSESNDDAGESDSKASSDSGTEGPSEPRFDSISLFDLDDGNGDEPAARRSRRGRGRRRGRAKSGEEGGESDGESEAPEPGAADEAEPESRGRGRGRSRGRGARKSVERAADDEKPSGRDDSSDDDDDDDDDSVDDISDTALPVVADIDEPDLKPVPEYDDDDSDDSDDDSDDGPAVRLAEVVEEDDAPTAEESDLRRPRRRAAIIAHADRGSIIAAILLARDLRMLEGFWVFPQDDLMTFFRSIATDLREQTPIYLVGFTASPARDVIQAASLYAGRIAWFDHHDWPPEDLDSLRETIGAQNVTVTPGNETSVSAVLIERTRRSRFSDKIVELATGRFTEHDFERWGRVWWERLASIAEQAGDRRAEVDAMLVGRPSDLAREAAKLTPPPPPEVAFVASRDFRIVHFGGYRMVVVPVPPEFDLHLTARVARERYEAELSLSFIEGEELMAFSGDEGRTKRNLDMLSMAAHLDGKHDWIEKLSSEDYVARIRVHDFAAHPDRLDEVISQIAMGRSILEG